MTEKNIPDDIDELRLKIIKKMFTDFPDLKIQITKTMLIEGTQSTENTTREMMPLMDRLASIAENSRYYHHSEPQNDSQKDHSPNDSIPAWAKLRAASVNRRNNERYYYFNK